MNSTPIDATPAAVRQIFSTLIKTGAPICVVAREYIETAHTALVDLAIAEETIARLRRQLETQ